MSTSTIHKINFLFTHCLDELFHIHKVATVEEERVYACTTNSREKDKIEMKRNVGYGRAPENIEMKKNVVYGLSSTVTVRPDIKDYYEDV